MIRYLKSPIFSSDSSSKNSLQSFFKNPKKRKETFPYISKKKYSVITEESDWHTSADNIHVYM